MRKSRLAAALLAVAVAGTAVAFASGAVRRAFGVGTVQTVTACIHNGNAELRIASSSGSCGNAEGALTWNASIGSGILNAPQVGDVFTAHGFAGLDTRPQEQVDVQTLSLPAGNYAVSGKTQMNGKGLSDSPRASGDCEIVADGKVVDATDASFSTSADAVPLPVQAVVTLDAPAKVILRCRSRTEEVYFAPSQLTALVVGHVNP